MSRPDLSLCLIFRDEEAMLPDFIASVADLWDEFIALDTGSGDRSTDLLHAAGAQVETFSWCDDFAAARNASLEHATGRWILFLDADERPGAELKTQIRALMRDEQAGAATVVMRNEWPDGTTRQSSLLRLFRNDPAIRFRYRIHEDVSEAVHDFLDRRNLSLRHLPGTVRHLGYSREVAHDRDKKERDLALLRRSLETEPDDFYCWFKIMEIARFWDDGALWQETADQVAALLDGASPAQIAGLRPRPFSGEMAALVAQGMSGPETAQLAWLEQAAGRLHPHPLLDLRRGLLLENLGRPQEAEAAFLKALQSAGDRPETELRPRLALCRLALQRGDLLQAADHAARAAALNPLDGEARLAAHSLAQTLVAGGEVERALPLLEPLAEHDPSSALGFLLCCLCLDRPVDLQLEVEQQDADRLLQEWIRRLWSSRQVNRLEAFADGCGAVVPIFPWLPEFLAAETGRLGRQG